MPLETSLFLDVHRGWNVWIRAVDVDKKAELRVAVNCCAADVGITISQIFQFKVMTRERAA